MLDHDKTKEQLIAELHNLEKLVEARTAELTALNNQLHHEIEQHKATQEALQHSEFNFLSLVELSPDGIGIEQNGKVIFINAVGVEMLGAQSPDQIIGKLLMDLVHPDYQEKVRDRIQKIRNDKTQLPYIEEKLIRLDGGVIDVEAGSAACSFNNIPSAQVVFRDITKRKADEEALRTSEEQLRSVIETAHDAIITIDHQGIITSWNTAASRIYGYSADEIIGQPVFKIIPKRFINAHQHKAQEAVSSASLAKPTRMADLAGRKKDGAEFPAEISVSFWESSAGTCVTAIIRDISERKTAERNLLESEARFRNLAESATDAIVLVNDAGEVFFYNNSAAQIFGYSKDEAIGMPLKNIVGPHDAHQQAFTRFQTNNSSFLSQKAFESQGVRKDGQVFPVELSISFWKTLAGGVYGAIIRDITQRRLTEDSLRRSEEQFRSLVETASDAIITTDLQGTIITWNKGAENVYGYSADEIINKSFIVLFPGHFAPVNQTKMLDLFTQHNMGIIFQDASIPAKRKDGSEFQAEGSVSKWESNEGIFLTALVRDITERRQAEEALRRSEEQFRSVIATASDAIITADSSGIIVGWNNGAKQIFGYSADEIMNKPYLTLMPERLHAKYLQRLKGFDENSNNVQRGESFGRRKDGSEFPAEGSLTMWKTEKGVFFTTTARDISDRKLTEKALHESETKFRTMTEAIPASIFIYQGPHLVYANPAAQKTSGYSFEELQKMNFWDIVHPEFRAQAREWGLRRQIGEEMPSQYELKAIHKNGTERWFYYTAAAIEYQGRPAVLGTAIDITDRKRAEEALRQSEERYRLTADMVPIHLGATDLSYKYSLWNKYSEKMFGYTQEEVLNKLSPLNIHETAEEAQEVVDTAINNGIFDKELRFRRKDGSLFPAHLIVVPDRDGEGNVKGLYGFAEDIIMRRKAENIVSQVDNCLLSLTPDPDSNIQYLVESAGKILGGDCSAYHSMRGSSVNIKAEWNVPVAHKKMYSLKGSPFLHLLSQHGAEPFIINNAEELGPHVTNESLSFHVPYKTLLAIPVRTGKLITGSMHIAYNQQQSFTKTELNAFSILSKAIGIEEERKKALVELKRKQKLLSKSEKSLKHFSAKVLSIREEEKKNISSALHDEIGSMVVALSAHLTLTKDEIIENKLDQAIKNIVQTEATLKQSVEKLKSIALDLRPPDLDIVGLSTALKNHFLSLSAQTKIAVDFTSTVKDRSIHESTAIVLYRVCQEALNNIVSHAKARTVAVQLTSKNGQINLAIQDDGCGFDTKKRVEFSRKSNKLGIIGMRERVESLGGTFTIESNMNKGTSVFVSVPHI